MVRKSKYDYIIGQRFGFIEPIEYIGKSSYKCLCHRCGNETTARAEMILKGKKKSCGCLPSYKDITGQDFGTLHVDKFVDIKYHHAFWECTCNECGKVKVYEGRRLRDGSASCGCVSLNRNDLTGKIFGELTVESYAYTKNDRAYWNCKCSCGNNFIVMGKNLLNNNTKSCGHLKHRIGDDNPLSVDRTGIVYNNGLKAIRNMGHHKWEFECLYCGKHKVLSTGDVVLGKIKSCGCLNPSSNGSTTEHEIRDYVQELLPNVEISKGRFLDNKEIDIYIPNKHIGIEYNGSAFHSSVGGAFANKPVKYHQDKFLLAKEKGIHLISIYDFAWKHNKEKIKMYLKDLLIPAKKIFARKCVLKVVPKNEAMKFTNKYHLQGSARLQEINLGLYYQDEIISLMSFGKPRYKGLEDAVYELQRYCIKAGFSVIGGAEKLMKHFIQSYQPLRIISYSDNNYFLGDIYPRLGFKFVKYTDPDYCWVDGTTLNFLSRYKCQVQVLKQKYPDLYNEAVGGKENYIMTKLGYFKIYGSGNTLWEVNFK